MSKILLVDDTPEILNLYSLVFAKRGHEVMTAASVMQAMDSLKTTEYDYVFVDIRIPDYDGFYFLKESKLELEHPHTKVIILSNSESTRDFDKAKALGAEEYLVKIDYSPYGLAEMIKRHEL